MVLDTDTILRAELEQVLEVVSDHLRLARNL